MTSGPCVLITGITWSLSFHMAEDLGSLLFPSSSVEVRGEIIWVDYFTDIDRNMRKDGWMEYD